MVSTQVLSQDENKIEVNLTVKPNKCISLHKGQTCFQRLKFQWALKGEGEFCLYQVSLADPLICWNENEKRRFEYQFKSASNEVFQIRQKGQEQKLAEVEVKLAWVYRTGKKSSSSWRLF